jgi:MFS family permease
VTTVARDSQSSSSGTNSRGFIALWGSIGITSVGDGAFIAAAPLLAAALTRDPLGIAAVSVAGAAPWFVVGLFAGAWVDRLPRRCVLLAAESLRGLALIFLASMIITTQVNIFFLAVTAFAVTAGRCFFDAAAQAIVPQVVGRDNRILARVNGRIFATETVGSTLIGPPIGGSLFALAPWAPFLLDAVSFGGSALALTAVPANPAPELGKLNEGIFESVRVGLRYLLRSRELISLALTLAAYNVGYNMASATLVLFTQDVLNLTGVGFGLLLAAGSVGSVITGWVAQALVERIRTRGAVLLSGALQAVAWLALFLAPSVWLAGLSFGVVGAASTLITVAVVSERQRTVPDAMLGRVVSAFRLIGNGLATLGGVVSGLIATVAGVKAPILVAAIFLLTTFAVLAVRLSRPLP